MMQWICCSYLYSDWFSKYLWENAGTKNTCTGKTEIKQCLRETLGMQRSGYLWNISVVVCKLTGLDKNWTDFKKKARTASKARATGMILVYSGFSVSSWCSGSTRQSQRLRIFLPVKSDSVLGIPDREIEVVTIPIDETTMLEITSTIALPYSDQVWQRLSVLFVQSFCFACKTCSFFYFLFAAVFRFVFLSSVVAL